MFKATLARFLTIVVSMGLAGLPVALVHAQVLPLGGGTVFDPTDGLPWGQWDALPVGAGYTLVWWETTSDSAKLGAPCWLLGDGELAIDWVSFNIGAANVPGHDPREPTGGPLRPTLRAGASATAAADFAAYTYPAKADLFSGWTPATYGRLVLDPYRASFGFDRQYGQSITLGFFISGSDTFSMFGSNYGGLAKAPVNFGPNGPLPSQWTDEGFTQRASPLIWPPNTTVYQEPYTGFPWTDNTPPIDLVGSVPGPLGDCAGGYLPGPTPGLTAPAATSAPVSPTPTVAPTPTVVSAAKIAPTASSLRVALTVNGQTPRGDGINTSYQVKVGSTLTVQASWDAPLDSTGYSIRLLEQGKGTLANCTTGTTCVGTDTRTTPTRGRIYDAELHTPNGNWSPSQIYYVDWVPSS